MKFAQAFCVPLTASMLLMGGHGWAQSLAGPPQRLIVKWARTAVPSGQVGSVSRAMSDAQATFGITLQPMRTLATGGQVMQLAQKLPPRDLQNLVTMLAQDAAVEYVHEDVLLQTAQTSAFVPNDPLYSQQRHLIDGSGSLLDEKFKFAWAKSGQGVRVAVVDTGITLHADLVANLLPGYDFISDPFMANDGNGRDASALDPGNFTAAGACGPGEPATNSTWHGTHVAGLIAAASGNSLGVAGVARNAKVLPVRAIGRCGGFLSDVAEAVIWAAGGTIAGVPANPSPAQIINLSLQGAGACNRTTQQVIDIARALGATLVVAAGNNNTGIYNFIPASCAGVIVVGAHDRFASNAAYSNTGTYSDVLVGIDVVAAGGGTTLDAGSNGLLSTANAGTTTPGADSYDFKTGTSMATAIVSGTLALMIEDRPGRHPDRIENALKTSAPPRCAPLGGFFATCEAGILDPNRAATALPSDPSVPVIAPIPCVFLSCLPQ